MSCENNVNDNKFYSCPARMSDGRAFTDYRPRCAINYESLPEPLSSFDFRQYLIHNADKVMDATRYDTYKRNHCSPCLSDPGTMLPEQNIQVCDGRKCAFPVNDPNGLGVGRKYSEGSEGAPTPAQLGDKNCSAAYNDLLFYPIDGQLKTDFKRMSVPSGGWPMRGPM
jgi:hypothetical protein